MSYRPQYAYPRTPRGFEDETFHYSFDSTNTTLLGVAIAAGGQANNIMLPLDPDAPFIVRGLKILLGTAGSNLDVQLKTPWGDYISTVPIPLRRWADGGGRAIAGKLVVPFEPEVECPAGGSWSLYLYNPTSGNVNPPAITLYGIKRRCGARRAA